MQADTQRLLRLHRLEKIRAIAKQALATEAARAEGTLAQLEALASRTGRLAADYAERCDAKDAAQLQQLTRFRAGLEAVSRNTGEDATRARAIADRALIDLAEAERRRAAVADRAEREAKAQSAKADSSSIANCRENGSRRANGTGLE